MLARNNRVTNPKPSNPYIQRVAWSRREDSNLAEKVVAAVDGARYASGFFKGVSWSNNYLAAMSAVVRNKAHNRCCLLSRMRADHPQYLPEAGAREPLLL